MVQVIYYSIKTSVIISIIFLNGCTNLGQKADCQKYWQGIAKSAQISSNIVNTQRMFENFSANIISPSEMLLSVPVFAGFVAGLGSIALVATVLCFY
jgi:hypothetical protein